MKSINPNIYPKGGFYFIDNDKTKIFGDTWAGVIARLRKYRERNHFPVGNPEADVMAQACENNPGLCAEDSAVYQSQVRKSSLKSKILLWIARFRASKEPHEFVPGATFLERAEVCAHCPMNAELKEGCASCRAALVAFRNDTVKGRKVDERLHACLVMEDYLQVAAHLETSAVDEPALPGNCWRKRTL